MNLLVDPAPTVYTLGDKEYPLNTSFRFGILFEQMMLDNAPVAAYIMESADK